MRSNFDYIIYISSTIICFASMIYILAETEYKLLIFAPLIIYGVLITFIEKNKRVLQYVKSDFEELGYQVLEEKFITVPRFKTTIKPAILFNGVPYKTYKSRYKRIFIAKDQDGKFVELNVIITESKKGEIKIDIKNKKYVTHY